MGLPFVALLSAVISLFSILLAVISIKISDDKLSLTQNHVFEVQCEIAGQIKTYQVEKIWQEQASIRFKVDDKNIMCSQFFVQEIAK